MRLLIFAFFIPNICLAKGHDVKAIFKHIDELWVEQSLTAEIEMEIHTKNYDRILKLDYWGKGSDETLTIIKYPKREKGVTTLKVGDDMFNYLPNIARTVKITEALRSQSWMGSHFTNDDLMRATPLSRSFTGKIVKENKKKNYIIIKATVKPDIVTPWKIIQIKYDVKRKVPLIQAYFSEKNELIRTISYSNFKMTKNKLIPYESKLSPKIAELKGEYTIMKYLKIDPDAPIPNNYFTLSYIKNR